MRPLRRLLILSSLFLCACTYSVGGNGNSALSSSAGTSSEKSSEAGMMSSISASADSADITLEWRHELSEGPYGTEQGQFLDLKGAINQEIFFGTFAGGTMATDKEEGAISAATFWGPGTGDAYAVFREGNSLVVRHQLRSEEAEPTQDEKENRWEIVKKISLPENAKITVIPIPVTDE